jgi:hypothetical protein
MNDSSCQGFHNPKDFGIQKQRLVTMSDVIPTSVPKSKRQKLSTEIKETEATRVMNIRLTKEIRKNNKQKSLNNLKNQRK